MYLHQAWQKTNQLKWPLNTDKLANEWENPRPNRTVAPPFKTTRSRRAEKT